MSSHFFWAKLRYLLIQVYTVEGIMTVNKSQVQQWVEAGALPPDKVAEALKVAGVTPAASDWRQFLERLLLGNGGAMLLAAIIFFFAANWEAMGRFAKFGLIELLMAAALTVYWRFSARVAGEASLTASAVLVGVLLAYYGQTYQTGADNWQLFACWAALILPWALLGRSVSLWLLWLLLVNLTLMLYDNLHPLLRGLHHGMPWLVFAFNTVALVAWEKAAGEPFTVASRGGPRLLALTSGFAMTVLAIEELLDPGGLRLLMVLSLYTAWMAAFQFAYRRLRPDLFMLAGLCLSFIVASTVGLAKWLFHGDGLGAFLVISLWIIGISSVAVRWLKSEHEVMSHEQA